MTLKQPNMPGYPQSEADMVSEALRRPLAEKITCAVELLRLWEPKALELSPAGYWLAYSGGKDSECILELARMAGVRHRPVYNVTTIDPPELVRFIKRAHPEVEFNRPAKHLLTRLPDLHCGPPMRRARWCCREYKEAGGDGLVKIIGVRIAESPNRAKLWRASVPNRRGGMMVCPIAYWTDRDVWAFHRERGLPHCCLYDQGFKRLGCMGCPNATRRETAAHFARWPRYEAAWRRAVGRYWLAAHDGTPWVSGFPTAQALWDWWRSGKRQGPRQACQGEFLFSGEATPARAAGAAAGDAARDAQSEWLRAMRPRFE